MWALYVHFVKGLLLDIPTNYHLNQFMFDRPRAKDELAPFFDTRCIYTRWGYQ